jgi:hypothetical protein
MKKLAILFYALLIGFGAFANDPVKIDEKLVQMFNTNFPNAKEVSWFEGPKFYIVNFTEKGIRSKITYQKDGTILQFTRSYTEQHLPYNIQYKVKKKYPEKKIFGITEFVSGTDGESTTEYYIKLEDDKNWITVRADADGALTVVEKYRKAVQ